MSTAFPVYDAGRRLDAGRGLWLRGIGGGRLEAVPGQTSGILVYGEQRGAALCDFDGDGRVDLAVSQNGAETKLYQNVLGKPGLRVRLAGPPGNPDGVGATMRLVFGGRMGAAREIHGGSGYWSQDSAVQVMGCPEIPTQIWIRWPGGKTTTRRHSGRGAGNHGGHGRQGDGESLNRNRMRLFYSAVVIILAGVAGNLPCAAQLQWHQEKGFKWAELQVPRDGTPGFTLLPPEQTGITFTNALDQRAIATHRVLANGCGVAIGDFDNDGLPDIFLAAWTATTLSTRTLAE